AKGPARAGGGHEFLPRTDVDAVLAALDETYPDAWCELVHQTPFELLVATILSAQCTDERVNIITARIFPTHNRPEHFAALTYEELEEMIRDRKSTRLNSSHVKTSYAVFCVKNKES